jgi:hypothetical protein
MKYKSNRARNIKVRLTYCTSLCRSVLKGHIYQVQLPYRGPINITAASHHAKKEKIQLMSAMKTTAFGVH